MKPSPRSPKAVPNLGYAPPSAVVPLDGERQTVKQRQTQQKSDLVTRNAWRKPHRP